MSTDWVHREHVIAAARSLYDRGLTHGRTGNISVRHGKQILVTPTGACLGTVRPGDLSVVDGDGNHLAGPPPSKEAFFHATVLRQRPSANAVVHTHSTYSAAVSCLDGLDPHDAIPPLTAYFAMRIGRLPLLPYHPPGDPGITEPLARAATDHPALLLANHGPVVAGTNLDTALDTLEELEHTAELYLLLRGRSTRPLTDRQRDALHSPPARRDTP
ncbi:3-oxo-tetronate 4-phosphate decarboxylase [Amycolatopsis azurea]|uniref:3-oxo-tetronate 4-phosphate decarboxylase n=1 Tax=Amycolatopsis azurea DSM 43854 TaxID=1238180 RepID=M2PXZ0_9PSEU|nr:3-oxo-tetronate 4-phosphate decarboxylase [Amycolatopsis azurea]EMD29478.1 Ribulose-5-phosphate 4-epimerase [Amycolatopsis azurea DSM 43854]OOC02742.1 aldolase [Amycolatopsis azurea DSM 43854]